MGPPTMPRPDPSTWLSRQSTGVWPVRQESNNPRLYLDARTQVVPPQQHGRHSAFVASAPLQQQQQQQQQVEPTTWSQLQEGPLLGYQYSTARHSPALQPSHRIPAPQYLPSQYYITTRPP